MISISVNTLRPFIVVGAAAVTVEWVLIMAGLIVIIIVVIVVVVVAIIVADIGVVVIADRLRYIKS